MDKKTPITRILFAIFMIAAVLFSAAIVSTPTWAQTSFDATQANCKALTEELAKSDPPGRGNKAHPENEKWVACFVNGWVNWVYSESEPLPSEPPQAVKDALEKGFVQLTEPWAPGCDNTLAHPKCSIGYLRLFNDWGTLRAFLAKGEFVQEGVTKRGPWTNGSLWFTTDFVQLAEGKEMTASDRDLFKSGAIWLAFALDGEYPLPVNAPIDGDNTYALRESWRGGCVGDQLPDSNCNVGQVLIYKDWAEMLKYLKDNNWTRGSVCANCKVAKMEAIKVATATPLPTATLAASATKVVLTATQGGPTAQATVYPTATRVAPTATPTAAPKTATTTSDFPWWTWGCLLPLAIVALLVVIFRRPLRDRWNTMRAQMEADGD